MELGRVEDYAVRALVDLALHPDARIREIADRTAIPAPHLTKVLQLLARAGLVETTRGRAGGTRLARDADTIRLRDVIEAVQGPLRFLHCPRRGLDCPRDPDCKIYRFWIRLHDQLGAHLDTVRIADLLHTCSELR